MKSPLNSQLLLSLCHHGLGFPGIRINNRSCRVEVAADLGSHLLDFPSSLHCCPLQAVFGEEDPSPDTDSLTGLPASVSCLPTPSIPSAQEGGHGVTGSRRVSTQVEDCRLRQAQCCGA